jgi:hypothetical protein
MEHDQETTRATWRTRRALARRRERSGLASLTIDVPADALTAALQASGAIEPGTRPTRAQLAQHVELLLLTQLSECQQPCRRSGLAGASLSGVSAGEPATTPLR